MKLLRVHVISADTCGGLLDDMDVWFRSPHDNEYSQFDPLCLIGPNGTGKSQFLQVLSELFQSAYHTCVPSEERIESNSKLQFEIEYLIRPDREKALIHVRIARMAIDRHRPKLVIQKKDNDGKWQDCDPTAKTTQVLLPKKVIGYTSGENETLSLPFLVSRSGYAEEVGRMALNNEEIKVPDTRLMLIDYGTNLEVVVSNLLSNDGKDLKALLDDAKLKDLHSFRCIIQLAHSAAPKLPGRQKINSKRKGIQLTSELEIYLDQLQRCATCYTIDEKNERYIFDYWVNDQTKEAFRSFWNSTLELYSSLHKLSMLNDLAIPKVTRERFRKETKERRFASRLPEPQDEDKVFRFDQVRFVSKASDKVVDYVSLSDGEHQLVQILGIFSMLSFSDVLFLLDEPESHLNPLWRVKFISRLLELPTKGGKRGGEKKSQAAEQDCLLTTHAPFVPSDMAREKVFLFEKNEGKVEIHHPFIETYGTTFDTILEECFSVRPPISGVSRKEIESLMKSEDIETIQEAIDRLGHSVEKVFLVDRLHQLVKKGQ
jgi:restriction system-associated AAA family ATPase